MGNEKSTTRRYRNFGAVLYPESAPENWREIIADWKIPVYVSPLHDKDIDPQNQPKKPHFHVLVAFDAVKNPEQARELFATVNAVGCEIVQSLRGYARYLCHLDNPEKARYDPEKVATYGGADYADTIGLPTDKYKAIDDMIEYCEISGTESYRDLLNYSRMYHRDWFRVLCDNGTVVMKEYLKSKSWQRTSCRRSGALTETDGHNYARMTLNRSEKRADPSTAFAGGPLVDDDGVILDDDDEDPTEPLGALNDHSDLIDDSDFDRTGFDIDVDLDDVPK